MRNEGIASNKTVAEINKARQDLMEVINFHVDKFKYEFIVTPKVYTETIEEHTKLGKIVSSKVMVEITF